MYEIQTPKCLSLTLMRTGWNANSNLKLKVLLLYLHFLGLQTITRLMALNEVMYSACF